MTAAKDDQRRRRKRGRAQTTTTAEARREEIIRLALSLAPVHVIAKAVGVTRQRVSDVLAEDEVKARLVEARTSAFRDAVARLRQGTRRAAEVLIERMEDRSGAVAVRAAIEVLSKAGADAPKKIDLGVLAGVSDEELWKELDAIRKREAEGGNDPDAGN